MLSPIGQSPRKGQTSEGRIMLARLKTIVFSALALAVGLASGAGAEPVKIRIAWVVTPAALPPILFAHEGIAPHLGKSYTFEPINITASPQHITAIAAGEPVTIFGDGGQSRDFTYIANVVEANLAAAEAEGANGRIFNIAAGEPHSVDHLVETIGRLLDKPVERRDEDPRPGDIRDSYADIGAARDTLGWEPRVGFEDGLRLTAEALLA